MTTVKIKDVKENMKVIEDVVNLKGAVLIKAGSAITEKHLKAFKLWGITEAKIEDSAQRSINSTGEIIEKSSLAEDMIDIELGSLFQKTDTKNPVIVEIYRLSKKRRLSLIKK